MIRADFAFQLTWCSCEEAGWLHSKWK